MNHSFDIDMAIEHGVPQAIILNNLLFWLAHNKAFGINIHDGKVWTFNSVSAYAELFPYWTVDQIRRYFESLEKAGVIIAGNFNKKRYDKTKWHTVADQSLIPIGKSAKGSDKTLWQNSQMDLAKKPNGFGEKAEPIPDINTTIKPDVKNTAQARAAKAAIPKKSHPRRAELIEHFDRIYRQLHNGQKMHWSAKELAAVDRLLKQFDYDLIINKARTLQSLVHECNNGFWVFTPSELLSKWNRIRSGNMIQRAFGVQGAKLPDPKKYTPEEHDEAWKALA